MSESILLPKLEQSVSERIEYEEPTKPSMSIDQTIPSTYTVLVEKTGEESFVATCLDLQGVFANGNNEEDVMKRIRTVIEEMLQVLGNPNKNFNLDTIVTF